MWKKVQNQVVNTVLLLAIVPLLVFAGTETKVNIHTLYSAKQAFSILNEAECISTYAVYESAVATELGIAVKIILDDADADIWSQKLLMSNNDVARFYGAVIKKKLNSDKWTPSANLIARPFPFQNACSDEVASSSIFFKKNFPAEFIFPDNEVAPNRIYRFAKLSSTEKYQLNNLALYSPAFSLSEVWQLLSEAKLIYLDEQLICPYALYFAMQHAEREQLADNLVKNASTKHGKLYGIILKYLINNNWEGVDRFVLPEIHLKFASGVQIFEYGEFFRHLEDESSIIREMIVLQYPKYLSREVIHQLSHQR
ncbi:MAG: hypothetical protein J6S87_02490 [Bacteroidales bacterium]|nr:hypothetical protein [Bacteroidales bacterium]MBP5227791.1 hypothetical protein [Kiritimatiellia bacterium]